jgi:ABC-type antimicrobial peptide transport system permease subunit
VEATGYLVVGWNATRGTIAASVEDVARFLEGIYSGMALLSAVAVGIAVSSIALADMSMRARETATLKALGAPGSLPALSHLFELLTNLALAAPVAWASGLLIAHVMARRAALAVGYLEPSHSPASLLTPIMAVSLGLALAWSVVAVYINYRRLDAASILRE